MLPGPSNCERRQYCNLAHLHCCAHYSLRINTVSGRAYEWRRLRLFLFWSSCNRKKQYDAVMAYSLSTAQGG